MSTSATISTVRPAKRRKFITHEMFAASPSVPASAKDPYLVNKIAFFQSVCFLFKLQI
jgi:hypothetical protein